MWNKIKELIHAVRVYSIDWILGVVGITDTYLSIFYTYQWQRYVGDSFLEAIIFSFVVVVFAVIIFEFAVRQWIMLKEDGKRHLSSYILFIIWSVVVSYSMTNTISTQYLNVMKDQVKTLEAQGGARAAAVEVPLLEEEIIQLDAEIASYETRRSQLEKVLAGVDSVEKIYEWKKTTATAQAQWEEVSSLVKEARTKRAETLERLRVAKVAARVEELKGSGTDVFAFYAQVLGIEDTSKVHFALAVFKGVILDLINVICFMLVMLRKKWRKEEHDRREAQAAEERKDPVKRNQNAAEALGEFSFGEKGAKNRLFISRKRALEELDVAPRDYDAVVERAVLAGVLLRRGGKVYRASWAQLEDFLREVKGEG